MTEAPLDERDQTPQPFQNPNMWNHDSTTAVEMITLKCSSKPTAERSRNTKGQSPFKATKEVENKSSISSGTFPTATGSNNDVAPINTKSPSKISNVSSSAVNNNTNQKHVQQLDGEAVNQKTATIPCCDTRKNNMAIDTTESCNENLELTPAVGASSIPTHSTNSSVFITTVSASTGKMYVCPK